MGAIRPLPRSDQHGRARPRVWKAFHAAKELTDSGVSVAEAVWRVIGPGGAHEMRRYAPPPRGRGDPHPGDAALVARYDSWIEECYPAAANLAAMKIRQSLLAGADDAVETVKGLARREFGDFEREVFHPRTGEALGRAIDAKAAKVSLDAAAALLGAVGVNGIRGEKTGGGVSVTANVAVGEGAQVVDFAGAIRSLRRRSVRPAERAGRGEGGSEGAKPVDAEVRAG